MRDIRLDGMRVLVMEDEYLIAMDVEQLCYDHGAVEVVIARNVQELGPDPLDGKRFHAAIVDVMLGGHSTLDFASGLIERDIPFVFATGYAHNEGMFDAVAGVEVISKPYAGKILIEALGRAISRQNAKSQAAFDPMT
ncbi:response regulator [Mesorhizobium sp. CAU 1732]|uniref:response regulator n=1 Tax=Mesorhizobium sp. CAU 1732 TaxID=3140358 RepID=UPI00326061E1